MKKILLPILLLLAGIICLVAPHFFSSGGEIDLKIQPASVIMPAAYKVYSNPDVAGGRYNLFKAIIKNAGKSEIHNLKVQFRIPKIIDEWTEVPSSTDLLPGQTAVVTCFPSLPQSVTEKNTSSKEKTDIKVTYGSKTNPTEKDESFTFDMTSVNDMLYSLGSDYDKAFVGDYLNNISLYACFVSAQDPIIKHYSQLVQDHILCGESGAGVGTGGQVGQKELDEKLRVMKGIYNATLISHMVYSETSAGVTQYGDNTTSTEHIRLPREVVSGNTGLCIELAILHASVYKAAGLHPVIFLIPGHAYPGIKIGTGYIAMESTGINGEGLGGMMSADQAYLRGMEELDTFFAQRAKGDPQYQILDIDDLYAAGYKDMELKPDPILQQETDKITQDWPVCLLTAVAELNKKQNRQMTTRDGNTNTAVNNTTSMLRYTGYISFMYPRSWRVVNHPEPQLPILATVISAPNGVSAIEVYQVGGAQSPSQAMGYIQQSLARLGVDVRYSATGQRNGMMQFSGSSNGSGGSMNWIGFFRNVSGGVEGVVVGSRGGMSQTLKEIIGSIN